MAGMYLPVEDELYFAQKGLGCAKNGNQVRVTDTGELSEMLVAYSFDYSDEPGKTESEMRILRDLSKRVRNIRSTNSMYDFCCTADGRFGAAINQTTKIWDIAGPMLIIPEAGGIVTDISGKRISLDISEKGYAGNHTIITSVSTVHTELLDIIRDRLDPS
jgi:myo-inositol-1(or 4)-monophosphatase